MKDLDAKTMETALTRLGQVALARGRIIDIAIYGGSALALAYDLRKTTKDVDAVFEADRDFVRKAAGEIATEMGLEQDWLNDAMKGYLSPKNQESLLKFGNFPSDDEVGLRVFVPAPEYFFAMKCVDIRLTPEAHDLEDARNLARVCGIRTADQALDLIKNFYPDRKLPAKAMFAVEELFERHDMSEIAAGRVGFDNTLRQHLRERNPK